MTITRTATHTNGTDRRPAAQPGDLTCTYRGIFLTSFEYRGERFDIMPAGPFSTRRTFDIIGHVSQEPDRSYTTGLDATAAACAAIDTMLDDERRMYEICAERRDEEAEAYA